MTKFWMVYGLNKGAPTARHKTERVAVGEASRLARKFPGDIFFVLEATRHIVKRDVDVTDLRDETPFDSRHAFDPDRDMPF